MKKIILILALFSVSAFAQNYLLPKAKSNEIATPLPHQLKWHYSELGAVFHYDLHVFDGKKYSQERNRIEIVEDYNIFNPTQIDTDQWVESAKAAGAKFAIITATHETGFAIYQSDVNPYCMKALKYKDGKGDIVADFVASCRKYGIAPGVYIGIRWNSIFGIHDFKSDGNGEFAQNRQEWYKRFCEKMVEEICTKYGELFMIWFDGGADDPKKNGPDVLPIVAKLQPTALFYHNIQRADFRWGGSESGTVEYPCWSSYPYQSAHGSYPSKDGINSKNLLKHGDPNGKYWIPTMADSPLRGAMGRHEWFWEPNDDGAVYSKEKLFDMYLKSVGRNSTLILGLTPDNRGVIPEKDVKVLAEFGKLVTDNFSTPIKSKIVNNEDSVTLVFDKPTLLKYAVIQEDITKGHRILKYKIDAEVNGSWQEISEGSAVGHKRIETMPKIKADKLRFTILEKAKKPIIKVSAY